MRGNLTTDFETKMLRCMRWIAFFAFVIACGSMVECVQRLSAFNA